MQERIFKNQTEWMILFFITGFICTRSIYAYNNIEAIRGNAPIYYLYIFVISLLLWLMAAAKANLFNIFLGIRSIPKEIKSVYLKLRYDPRLK